ncbi:ATP-binding cassette sub-family G member 4-like [Odontomachus brunneus]|uniref:ATP-binding cassette sub-family G member 4-like n=1 Tax=Odontomachus brunneus TaxID=486640 RepID=UPI0013F26CF7|nr:ATP-binding cassette sub-family G member 4-like [Odontomachus brunneus]
MKQKLHLTNITCDQAIDVKFLNLSYTVRTRYREPKKHILKGLSGIFRSAELTAIMGPSGAGKSTLLNILSGFQEGLYMGTVTYLNRGNIQNRDTCKKQLRYIQQMDDLHGHFTTQEIMMIASYLKIKSISHKSRQMQIDDILNTLTLSDTKETRTDQLSGGQRKRLSIALEMIDNPPLMFLDEPTTGLDSVTSIQCVNAFKTLAQTGRTIICTIHQPSAALYEMFDQIYLVVDGYCMYRSPPGNTVNYFALQGLQCPMYHNPADYMLEVVSKEYGDYDEQLIAAAKWPIESNNEINSITSSRDMVQKISDNDQMVALSPPTELIRFWVLLKRYMLLTYRKRDTEYIYLFCHIFVSLLAGMINVRAGNDGRKVFSNISCLFQTVGYAYYIGFLPAVLKFPLEINILRNEHFNNWYQMRTCYMAMLVSTIPLQSVYIFLCTFIVYLMTNQPYEFFRFSMYFFVHILTLFVSEGLGLGLGAIFNPVNGSFVGSMIFCIMLMLAGLFDFFKDMLPLLYYISYLNPLRYAFNGVVQSIYGNGRENLQCPDIYCHLRVPSTILEMLDFAKPLFWFDITVLFGYYVLFRILAYLLLKRRLSKLYLKN